MQEMKRALKDMSYTGLRTNSSKDFMDYSFSYYIPETGNRIEAAAEKFLTKIGNILEDDRKKAGKTEPHTEPDQGRICGSRISR